MNKTEYIQQELDKLQNNGALSHSTLIGSFLREFPDLKNRQLAANRINHILKLKNMVHDYKKIKGKDRRWYIIRNQQVIEDAKTNPTQRDSMF